MTEFTASNGVGVRVQGEGNYLDYSDSGPWLGLCGGRITQALREFFVKETDDRLGRWRWPEKPDYVVYPEGDAVRVLREAAGTNWYPLYRPINPVSADAAIQYRIAAAYFDAHPEPKPWHDAKPGEVWIVRFDNDSKFGEEPVIVPRTGWDSNLDVVSAIRIWPGVEFA